MKRLLVILMSTLLIGTTSCKNTDSFNFVEVVGFSIEEFDFVECHLSSKESSVFQSDDPNFILNAIDTQYIRVDSIIYNQYEDFDVGFYLYKENVVLQACVYLINGFFYVPTNDEFYKSTNPLNSVDVLYIENSIIR